MPKLTLPLYPGQRVKLRNGKCVTVETSRPDGWIGMSGVHDELKAVTGRHALIGISEWDAVEDVEPDWIEWRGGECPVSPGSDCEVRFRCGELYRIERPEEYAWGQSNDTDDIVAYRIWSRPPQQRKETKMTNDEIAKARAVLEAAGHTVTPPRPPLMPLVLDGVVLEEMPLLEHPHVDALYFYASSYGAIYRARWAASVSDIARFERGNCFATEAGALAFADALFAPSRIWMKGNAK